MSVPRWRPWMRAGALAAVYLVAARLSILLAWHDTNASPVWPPSGIAFAAILVWGPRVAPGIAAGAVAANLWAFMDTSVLAPGPAVAVAAAMGAGNTIEALAGHYMHGRWIGRRRMLDHTVLVVRLVAIVAAMCAVAASVGTGSLWAAGVVDAAGAGVVWYTWWLGDAGGILIVTPLLLALGAGRRPGPALPLRGEPLLLGTATVGVLLLVFTPVARLEVVTASAAYLLLPPVFWAAMRFEARATTMVTAAVAAGAIGGTIAGLGPFHGGSLHASLLSLQLFLCVLSVFGLLTQAAFRERGVRGPVPPGFGG